MLNERVSPQTVGVVRVVVFSLWLLNVWGVHLEDLAALPHELLSPYGLLMLIPGPVWEAMWTPTFLVTFKGVLLGCLLWLILGLRGYQKVAIATCVLITLFDGMEKSLGHINHSKFVMLYSAYILAAFPCADAVSLGPRKRALAHPSMYIAPVMAISLTIIMGYSLISAYRFGLAGPGLYFSDAIKHWFVRRSLEMSSTRFQLGLFVAETPLVLAFVKLGFLTVGVFEILSPLCLVSRWFRWLWVMLMVSFHFLSLFTMNIFFWHNAIIILLVFTNSDRVFGPREAEGDPPILFFDPEGGVGARLARRVLRSDLFGIFRFAPLGGATSGEKLPPPGPGTPASALVLLDGAGVHRGPDALARSLDRLGGLWRLARFVPSGLLQSFIAALSPRGDLSRDGAEVVLP